MKSASLFTSMVLSLFVPEGLQDKDPRGSVKNLVVFYEGHSVFVLGLPPSEVPIQYNELEEQSYVELTLIYNQFFEDRRFFGLNLNQVNTRWN